ncbi:MAG: ribbon-helix-helix protein, CopG family [Elusimicrobia bacterium]|nr:ribbon-helix-helix protein, CopG family [Elusimicrobiota bacterium]
MMRTSILADDGLILELRSMAQRAGVSVSEVIRHALEEFVRRHKKDAAYPSFIGAGSGGAGLRISERAEELLFQDKPRRSR